MSAGAVPVIADVDPNNYCMAPQAAARAISPKTKAIIPVHLGSNMADMDAIMALAEKHNLIVIEDCAHAHGAKWNGRGAGTIGHFSSFSLQSSKTQAAGPNRCGDRH
jgi:dTDP-4-amino-4,6-dideoxygalactose transaminase